jgi:hypothetical protein
MIWLILITLFSIWLIITEGNFFLKEDKDENDPTHQSID